MSENASTTARAVAAEFPLAQANGACLMLRISHGAVVAAAAVRGYPVAVTAIASRDQVMTCRTPEGP